MSRYCLLKAYPIEYDDFSDDNHFYIHAVADGEDYSIAVNMRSVDRENQLHYVLKELNPEEQAFLFPYLSLDDGLYFKRDYPGFYLDYPSQNLFSEHDKVKFVLGKLTQDILQLQIRDLTEQVLRIPSAYVLAFGMLWGPKRHEEDYTFHFRPGQGVHDIHSNQNSPEGSKWARYDRPREDGALYFVFPDEGRICAFYAMFR